MKDQYFGDKTDYIKHGILRQLVDAGFDLGIHWMWTEDDASTDGSRTSYLSRRDEFSHHDAPLFELLASCVAKGDRRLRILEEHNVIPGAVHCFDLWSRDSAARSKTIDSFLARLRPNSLVFLDPDNGLSTKSLGEGALAAHKYVFPSEVERIWSAGHSVMLYQHYPRVKRDKYIAEQLTRLQEVTPGSILGALVTSHVVLLLCVQPSHISNFRELTPKLTSRWQPHVIVRWLEDFDSGSIQSHLESST